jgi:hypothetical protein
MVTAVTCLDRLTVEPVDIELPEACPECGQDFSEPSSLVEIGYMAVHRTCRLVTDGGVTVVAEHETSDVTDELAFATGYKCGGCRKVIALASPHHRVPRSGGSGAGPAKFDGMIHPPASSAILTSLREAVRTARRRGLFVRIGSLGLLDMSRDGWETAPHVDGVSPIGAAILSAQPPTGIEWEQAAALALGCDLATLEGINDGLEKNEPSGVWGRSVAKDNYRDGFLAGSELRVELLAPAGALRVVS